MKKFIVILLSIPVLVQLVHSQQVTLDWKVADVGQVRQFLANNGSFWHLNKYDYPELINTEFPPNSYEEHVGEAGLWVGAITPSNDTLVTVTTSWNPWGRGEFWPPSNADWDTIWVVKRNQVVDIPYWPGYKGKSDRDFIWRFDDYNPVSLIDASHHPLYLDVIEVAHTWSSPDVLAQILLYEYYITPKEFDLKDVYITYWVDPNVGLRSIDYGQLLSDDYTMYFHDLKMGVGLDADGGADGDSESAVGFKLFPPDDVSPNKLRWTFNWGGGEPIRQEFVPAVMLINIAI